ncbi:MAG: hypothetical protein BGO99_13985 [Nitrosospira sp. 56-18]|nr:MAG: hypothetical protein BGO99_13985 [Nitrosospira sp. 56-18]
MHTALPCPDSIARGSSCENTWQNIIYKNNAIFQNYFGINILSHVFPALLEASPFSIVLIFIISILNYIFM